MINVYLFIDMYVRYFCKVYASLYVFLRGCVQHVSYDFIMKVLRTSGKNEKKTVVVNLCSYIKNCFIFYFWIMSFNLRRLHCQ